MTMDYEKLFAQRLTLLRQNKGVSARDMSLSLGQSECYINKIENGKAMPSMRVFFYICDYLNITPEKFFDNDEDNPNEISELVEKFSGLSSRKRSAIISLINEMS